MVQIQRCTALTLVFITLAMPAMAQTLQVPAAPAIASPSTIVAPAAPAAPEATKIPEAPPMPAAPAEPKATKEVRALETPGESLPAISPITYAKDQIVLLPARPLIEDLKDGALFQIEVKSAGAAFNPDWFQLSGLPANHGLLLTYTNPQIITIEPANIFAHYDVVAANEYGEIVLILPNVALANLTQAINTPQPAVVVLYVPGGTSSDIGLEVGDHLKHAMFKSRPEVMDRVYETPSTNAETPANETPAAPAPTPAPQTTPTPADAPTPAPAATVAPEATPDSNGRRRPSGNPAISKPTPPTAPVVAKPAKVVPAPAANSNLQQSADTIPPTQNAETKIQKSLLDMVLGRHHEGE